MSTEYFIDEKVILSKEERMETINQSLIEEPELVPFEILKELILDHGNVIAIKIAVKRYGFEFVKELIENNSKMDNFPFHLFNI